MFIYVNTYSVLYQLNLYWYTAGKLLRNLQMKCIVNGKMLVQLNSIYNMYWRHEYSHFVVTLMCARITDILLHKPTIYNV